jgi:hypothetical protein
MRAGILLCGAVLFLSAAVLALRCLAPGAVISDDHRELLDRIHRAMHRRPVLLFAIPLVLDTVGMLDTTIGVLDGSRSPFEVMSPLLGVVASIVLVQLWRRPVMPLNQTS